LTEEALGDLEMAAGALGPALRHEDGGAKQVRSCEVERVVGHLEQRHGPADAVERGSRAPAHVVQARERPVEADARVVVDERFRALERLVEHLLRAAQVSQVGERIAQVGGEPRTSEARSSASSSRSWSSALLENRHRLVRTAARRVGMAGRWRRRQALALGETGPARDLSLRESIAAAF
jgi:hypothetical protein